MRHLQGVRTEVVLSECILFYFTPPREDLHEVPPRSHAPGLGRKVSCESSWRFSVWGEMGTYPISFTHNSTLLTRELQLKVENDFGAHHTSQKVSG